jgi:hypothetical protein
MVPFGLGPGNGDAGDPSVESIELSMRSKIKDGVHESFREDVDGKITGVKLRETEQGPDEYLVSLWSADGVLLTSTNTGGQTADGWHVATFPAPVDTVADGRYSVVYWASPKDTVSKSARGEDVSVIWEPRTPTSTATSSPAATPTEDPVTKPSPTSSTSSPGGGGTSPASDIPLLPSYPNAANTGVPSGTSLKSSGSLTITKAGTVIDGYDVNGVISIQADNVTVQNTRVRGVGWWSIDVDEGSTGVVIKNCDIDGQGTSGRENSMGVMGPATVLRNDISGVENGVTPGSGSLIQDNYIHDLGAPGDPHYDSIQIDGSRSNITILHNTVLNQHNQTAAVMIDNYFGPIRNINVENNYLGGGGYTVYSDGQFSGGSITGVKFVNNKVRRGYWGYASIVNNSPVDSGNTDAESGKAITLDH